MKNLLETHLRSIFIFLTVSLILFHLWDEYVKVQDYISVGGEESLLTLTIAMSVLFFFLKAIFEVIFKKERKKFHYILLILLPLLMVELGFDLYQDYRYDLVSFDNWKRFYTQGVFIYKKKRDYKTAARYFIESYKNETDKVLVLKSKAWINYFNFLLKKEMNDQELQEIHSASSPLMSEEKIVTILGQIIKFRKLADGAQMLGYADKCLHHPTISPEVLMLCRIEQVKALIISEDWDSIDTKELNVALEYFKNEVKAFGLNQSIYNYFFFNSFVELIKVWEKKDTERVLDYWRTLLELLRDRADPKVVAFIYDNLARIYEQLGRKNEAEIFRYNQRKVLE